MDERAPTELAARMSELIRRTPEAEPVFSILRPVVRALAHAGRPVTVTELATATGIRPSLLAQILRDSPYAEWTPDDRLSGLGLTTTATPHRLFVDERELGFWSAIEGLVAATYLDAKVGILTSCHVTGTAIRLEISPGRASALEPDTAVVSVVARPEEIEHLRRTVLSRQLFFRSRQVASRWLADNAGFTVLGGLQAVEYARQLGAAF